MATAAPSPANFIAMARPIPRLPPVTNATRPVSGPFASVVLFVLLIPAITILLSSGDPFRAKLILTFSRRDRGAPSKWLRAREAPTM
jgi:hypothetical protein